LCSARPQHQISRPDPDYALKKKTIEDTRGSLKAGEVFYYADEFNISWLPTRAPSGARGASKS